MLIKKAWSNLARAILKQFHYDVKHNTTYYMDAEWYDELFTLAAHFSKINLKGFEQMKKELLERKKYLLKLLSDDWISLNDLRQKLNCSTQDVHDLINDLSDYPIVEEQIKGVFYLKLEVKK